ncbi:MAG: hypothetical protein R2813_05305 [Flavobacteriales bacterium]
MEFAINTPWDDFLFISDKNETTAWFASNRETGNKDVTVYRIGIDRIPLDLTLIKGTFEAEGSKKAKITIEDMTQNKVIGVYESERQFGEYLLDLRGSGKYKFIVEAEESNAIHTGLVEVPREKGLKQFRQEMILINDNGKEQLQIINHFDEPIEGDESLLTAEILKKQASLSVNSSEEDIVRTTELLDQPTAGSGNSSGNLDQAGMVENARRVLTILEEDARVMDKKSSLLYEQAQSKSSLLSDDDIAAAAIGAELAGIYKSGAENRAAVAQRLSETLDKLEDGSIDSDAFTAQYNQLTKSASNLKTREQFENAIPKDFEKRQDPIIAAFESKKEETETLKTDLTAIDEEIAYYKSEIQTTKDEAIKEELQYQLRDAENAKPEKQASLDRAKKEFEDVTSQRTKSEEYFNLTKSLLSEADKTYETASASISASAIDQLQNTLTGNFTSNPALIAMIEPEFAEQASEAALADSRKREDEKSGSQQSQVLANSDENNGPISQPETSEGSAQDNSFDMSNDVVTNAETVAESNNALNEEIRTIEGSESSPDIIKGSNYASILKQEIDEAQNAEDPIIAESRKAELYDQWADNIQYRIDSLQQVQNNLESDEEKLAVMSQIGKLASEKKEKEALAMASYEAIAELSDQEAISEVSGGTTTNELETAQPEATQPSTGESVASNQPTTETTPSSQQPPNQQPTTSDNLPNQPRQVVSSPTDSKSVEQRAIKNFPTLPSSVATMSQGYADRISAANSIADPIEKAKAQADANKQWVGALQEELIKMGEQIKNARPENRFALEETASEIGSLRLERQEEATKLTQKIDRLERETAYVDAQADLQEQMYEFVENYNSDAFTQLQSQIQDIPNADERNAQLKTLSKNWLMAIENEKIKTEARLNNTQDPNQQTELSAKLARLESEKLLVQIDLSNLEQPIEVEGPSAPKSVMVEGSERYEGYIAVEPVKAQEYDQKNQQTLVAISDKQKEIGDLQNALNSAKKKEKPGIERKIEDKQRELKTLQFESKFYQGAEPTLANAETALLSKTPGSKRPSKELSDKAAKLAQDADKLDEEAAAKRSAAEAVKKEEEREVLMADVRDAEHLALLKRRDADLTSTLALELSEIETAAIARNFLIPPGEEVVLPIVNTTLNPNERADVERTEQFQAYDVQVRKADSIRAIVTTLEQRESQLKDQGHNLMTESSSEENAGMSSQERIRTTNEAFVIYERADSISKEAARLTREAAMVENEANASLLQNPPEVYNAIISYYKTERPVDEALALIESEFEADASEAETQSIETSTPASASDSTDRLTGTIIDIQFEAPEGENVQPEQPAAVQTDQNQPLADNTNNVAPAAEDPFNLLPPTEGEAPDRINVKPDVLTNTIFEAVPNATTSVYSTTNPIPMDPELPSGIIYKVQIGAFRNAIRQDAFKGIKPITGESVGNGLTRYTAGEFKDFASADFAKDEVRDIGYRDAFVVAYRNGERISIGQARGQEGAAPVVASNNRPAAQPTNTPGPVATTAPPPRTGSLPPNSPIKQGDIVIQDVSYSSGTFFTVQVGVYSKPVSSGEIYNITPLNQENLPNGTYRYSTGKFNNETIATKARDDVRTLGVSDAFVTAYHDGVRITLDDARSKLGSAPSPPAAPVQSEQPVNVDNTPAASGYRISLGTFQGSVPVKEASAILSLDGSKVEKVSNNDGSSTYYYGSFSTQEEAQAEATRLSGIGLNQAQAIQR